VLWHYHCYQLACGIYSVFIPRLTASYRIFNNSKRAFGEMLSQASLGDELRVVRGAQLHKRSNKDEQVPLRRPSFRQRPESRAFVFYYKIKEIKTLNPLDPGLRRGDDYTLRHRNNFNHLRAYLSAYGALPPKPPRSSPCPDHDPALYGAAAGALQVLRNRRRRKALGARRFCKRASRPGRLALARGGEVTSPLFSITSILNATWY
jgi:hypothetical protein